METDESLEAAGVTSGTAGRDARVSGSLGRARGQAGLRVSSQDGTHGKAGKPRVSIVALVSSL